MNNFSKWLVRVAFTAACFVTVYLILQVTQEVLPILHLSVSVVHIILSLYLHLYPLRWSSRTENWLIAIASLQSGLLGLTLIQMPLESALLFGVTGVFYVLFSLIHFSSHLKYRDALAYIVFFLLVSIALKVVFFKGLAIGFYDAVPYFDEALAVGMLILFVATAFRYRFDSSAAKGVLLEKEQTINWFSTLVNLVSHNLRSPLASILGNTQILQAKHPSIKEDKELKRIITSVDTANGIIDRLLKASFVTDQAERIALKKSILKAYPTVVISGEPTGSFTYEQSVCIHLAMEVFLDNALKYTSGKVTVTFNKRTIVIQDLGPGLPNDAIENFASVKNHSVGTLHGIGVPFASRLLQSIGYQVKAENTYPGLRITISPEVPGLG